MKYGIGLGSNLGDRLLNLQQALSLIEQLPKLTSAPLRSPIYLTQAVDCEDGAAPFYNMAAELESELSPLSLLSHLREIEEQLGRPKQRQYNASRNIDLDILYADGLVINSETLTLPHPRLHQRRFVLQPLADIRAELILPNQSKKISLLLSELHSNEAPLQTISSHLLNKQPAPTC